MKIHPIILAIFSVAVAVQGHADPLRVVSTTTDLAALTEAVGGDLVDVQAIARGTQDPHFVDARPSFMRRMRGADLHYADLSGATWVDGKKICAEGSIGRCL